MKKFKVFFALAVVLLLSFGVMACNKDIDVTGVSLQATASVEVGQTTKLDAEVAPDNATDKSVTWSSSDETVATVDGGTVTGVSAGTATITVTTVSGGHTATCTVTVTNPAEPVVPATGVTLNHETASVTVGDDVTLTATVAPEDATDKSVTWSSDAEAVATVDEDGVVTGVSAGTATITVTTVSGGHTDDCVVTVNAIPVPATEIALNSAAETLYMHEDFDGSGVSKFTLTAAITPANATDEWTWAIVDGSGAAATSDVVEIVEGTGLSRTVQAKLADGVATAGTAIIRVSSSLTPTVFDDITVTVVPYNSVTGIPIATAEDLDIVRKDLSLKYYLTADIDLQNATIKPFGVQDLVNGPASTAEGDRVGPNSFSGVFDGRGHTISNFTIQAVKADGSPATSATGSNYYDGFNNALFPGLWGGTIKNLAITGVKQTGETNRPSLLVNSLYAGTIENVYMEGEITAPTGGTDDWRRGGVIFGGTGDNSAIMNAAGSSIVVRNVVANVTVVDSAVNTGRRNMIYPVTGRIDANRPASKTFENLYIVNDGLDQAGLSGLSAAANKISLFAADAAGDQDYSVLPDYFWEKTDGELPALKALGTAPQGDLAFSAVTADNVGDSALGLKPWIITGEPVIGFEKSYSFTVEVRSYASENLLFHGTPDLGIGMDAVVTTANTTGTEGEVAYTAVVYTYTIPAAYEDIDITAVGGVSQYYGVTLPTDVGYTLDGAATADKGETYTVTFEVNPGYIAGPNETDFYGDLVIKYTMGGGAEVTVVLGTPEEGVFTIEIEDVSGAIVFTVEGVRRNLTVRDVTLITDNDAFTMTGENNTLIDDPEGGEYVADDSKAAPWKDYTITIAVDGGYKVVGDLIVSGTIGGVDFTAEAEYDEGSGNYIVTIGKDDILGNIVISDVENVFELFAVTGNDADTTEYTVAGTATANGGEDYEFTVTVKAAGSAVSAKYGEEFAELVDVTGDVFTFSIAKANITAGFAITVAFSDNATGITLVEDDFTLDLLDAAYLEIAADEIATVAATGTVTLGYQVLSAGDSAVIDLVGGDTVKATIGKAGEAAEIRVFFYIDGVLTYYKDITVTAAMDLAGKTIDSMSASKATAYTKSTHASIANAGINSTDYDIAADTVINMFNPEHWEAGGTMNVDVNKAIQTLDDGSLLFAQTNKRIQLFNNVPNEKANAAEGALNGLASDGSFNEDGTNKYAYAFNFTSLTGDFNMFLFGQSSFSTAWPVPGGQWIQLANENGTLGFKHSQGTDNTDKQQFIVEAKNTAYKAGEWNRFDLVMWRKDNNVTVQVYINGDKVEFGKSENYDARSERTKAFVSDAGDFYFGVKSLAEGTGSGSEADIVNGVDYSKTPYQSFGVRFALVTARGTNGGNANPARIAPVTAAGLKSWTEILGTVDGIGKGLDEGNLSSAANRGTLYAKDISAEVNGTAMKGVELNGAGWFATQVKDNNHISFMMNATDIGDNAVEFAFRANQANTVFYLLRIQAGRFIVSKSNRSWSITSGLLSKYLKANTWIRFDAVLTEVNDVLNMEFFIDGKKILFVMHEAMPANVTVAKNGTILDATPYTTNATSGLREGGPLSGEYFQAQTKDAQTLKLVALNEIGYAEDVVDSEPVFTADDEWNEFPGAYEGAVDGSDVTPNVTVQFDTSKLAADDKYTRVFKVWQATGTSGAKAQLLYHDGEGIYFDALNTWATMVKDGSASGAMKYLNANNPNGYTGYFGGVAGNTFDPDLSLTEMEFMFTADKNGVYFVTADVIKLITTPGEEEEPETYSYEVVGSTTTRIDVVLPAKAVGNADEFEAIRNNLNREYYLTNDIDFGGAEFLSFGYNGPTGGGTDDAAGRTFDPEAFTGVLDGKGYALRNIKVTSPNNRRTGIFTQIGKNVADTAGAEAGKNGLVKNLQVIGAVVTGPDTNGIIAGNNFGLVTNCYVEGQVINTVTGQWNRSGMIVGANEGGKGMVTNSVSKGTAGAAIGGAVGWNGRLTNVFAVSDGLTDKNLLASDGAVYPGSAIFAMADIANVDFSVLDEEVWTLTAGQLPVLKNAGGAASLKVNGLANGTGYTMKGVGYVAEGAAYTFTVTLKQGYVAAAAGVKASVAVGAGEAAAIDGVAGEAGVYTFTVADVDGAITIGAVTGVEVDPALVSAREEAAGKITDELAKYTETDYEAADWTALNKLATDATAEISAEFDIAKVTGYDTTTLFGKMDAVLTKVERLAEAKEALTGEIDEELAKYTQGDYGETEWTTLTGLASGAKTTINDYTTIEEVNGYDKAGLFTAMDAVKTEAEKLADAKETAIDTITEDFNTAYTEGNFAPVQWKELVKLLDGAKAEINGLTTVGEVTGYDDTALTTALATMAAYNAADFETWYLTEYADSIDTDFTLSEAPKDETPVDITNMVIAVTGNTVDISYDDLVSFADIASAPGVYVEIEVAVAVKVTLPAGPDGATVTTSLIGGTPAASAELLIPVAVWDGSNYYEDVDPGSKDFYFFWWDADGELVSIQKVTVTYGDYSVLLP